MAETYHYSDLQTFWECPRRWSYQRDGWQPYLLPLAMLRGLLVDRGVAAAWRDEEIRLAIAEEVALQLKTIESGQLPDLAESRDKILATSREALGMAQWYMQVLGSQLKPIAVGIPISKPFAAGTVIGTPDCVAIHRNKKVLVELKTGHDPNPRMYSMTGQADFYAYLIGDIDLVYYDLVSPTSVMRHERPPRMDRGAYLFSQLEKLALHIEAGIRFKEQAAIDNPRYGWWCGSCPFMEACQTRDDGGDDEEVLLMTVMNLQGMKQ